VETPLVIVDFRTKSMYAVTDPARDPKVSQALRDSRAEALTSRPAAK
jgi:hypothetical protein